MEEMLAMIEAAKDDVANVTQEDIDALLLKSPIPGTDPSTNGVSICVVKLPRDLFIKIPNFWGNFTPKNSGHDAD